MPRKNGKLAGINHLNAVKALEKAGFHIARQGKHIVMSNNIRIVTIPRHNPVNAFPLALKATFAVARASDLETQWKIPEVCVPCRKLSSRRKIHI